MGALACMDTIYGMFHIIARTSYRRYGDSSDCAGLVFGAFAIYYGLSVWSLSFRQAQFPSTPLVIGKFVMCIGALFFFLFTMECRESNAFVLLSLLAYVIIVLPYAHTLRKAGLEGATGGDSLTQLSEAEMAVSRMQHGAYPQNFDARPGGNAYYG